MTLTTKVYLDTRYGSIQDQSPANCHFRVASPREGFYNHIRFKSITLLNGVLPLNSSNNTLVYVENSTTTVTTSITPGFYTGSSLASQLATQLTAASTTESITYTVTYDSSTAKITIACDSSNTFEALSTSTILDLIGFKAVGSAAVTTVGDYPIRLDGTQYLDFQTNIYNSINVSTNNRSISERIPMTVGFGEYLYYTDNDSSFTKFNGRLESIDCRLIDDRGNSFELPANCHVQYVFELSQ